MPPRQEYNPYTPPVPPQQASGKKKKKGTHVVAVALCCSILGGVLGAGGVLGTQYLMSGTAKAGGSYSEYLQSLRESSILHMNEIDASKKMTPAEVYAKNVNSTVGITTSITTNFWGYQTTAAASGSGFILTDDGYILTNHHVIENSTAITVALYDGTTYDAKLIGADPTNDIAVLKVDAKDLVPVVLGDSSKMNVGEEVLAIGNPLGELTFSLTAGNVSALDREITMSNGRSMKLVQTDCAINSGNSGGALFNLYGEVVGITNAKYSSNPGQGASIDNIGFAIPITDVMPIVNSIIEKGYIAKPYIGVSVTNVSAEMQAYGLPSGASIRSIVEDGPADKAGLKKNDIITHIDGKEIETSNDLIEIIREHKVGETLTLSVFRQGETLEMTIEIGEQIQSAQQ